MASCGDELYILLRNREEEYDEDCLDYFLLENSNKIKILQDAALCSLFLRETHEKLHGFMNILEEKGNHQFFSLCRVTKNTFNKLVQDISNNEKMNFKNVGREKINPRVSVMMTLWYLGRQCTYSEISEQFGVTLSSVHKHVELTIDIINEIFSYFIRWPSREKVELIEGDFNSLANFPGVIGAIDGCHIKIKAPEAQQRDFLDRTMNHSVNLLAVCDANKKFTYVNIGFPGSAHDQRVFSLSSLGKSLEQNYKKLCYNDNFHLIGDSAFALKPYIMVPFKDFGNLTPEKEIFNKKLSATRRVIENAFGWLKGRFRRLKFIDADLHRITSIVQAACIIHNITVESEEEISFLENEITNKFEEHTENFTDSDCEASSESLSAVTKRERIVRKIALKS